MYRGCANKSIKSADFVIYWRGAADIKNSPGSIIIQAVNDTKINQRHRIIRIQTPRIDARRSSPSPIFKKARQFQVHFVSFIHSQENATFQVLKCLVSIAII